MAKARVIETDEDESLTAQAEELAKLNEEEGGEVYRAIDELRGTDGVQLMIVRVSPQETSGYVGMMPVAEFSHDRMQKLYGGGLYKVRVKGPKGFLPGGGPVKIADAPQKANESSGGNFQTYLEYVQRQEAERKARTDDWIKLAITASAPIIAAWMSRPTNQGTDIAALVTALKPAPGPSITDLTGALANMQSLTAPKESNTGMIDTIFKAFEFAKEMGGGSEGQSKEGGSNWVDVIRDVIKAAPDAIKPMLEARMAAMQAAQAGQPVSQVKPQISPVAPSAPVTGMSPPSSAPSVDSVSTAATTSGNTNMIDMFLPLIKVNLSKVAGWAEKNRDPQIYAEVLIDELPDNFGSYIPLPDVLGYLNHPQWFETICGIEGRLQPFREWCDECRLAVIEIMKGFEQESEPAPTNDAEPVSAES